MIAHQRARACTNAHEYAHAYDAHDGDVLVVEFIHIFRASVVGTKLSAKLIQTECILNAISRHSAPNLAYLTLSRIYVHIEHALGIFGLCLSVPIVAVCVRKMSIRDCSHFLSIVNMLAV